MRPGKPYNSLVLCTIFFLSGISALVFETLWFRLAGLTFGNSVWASAIVLSSFMGGLALGNGIMAFWGCRGTRPLRAYAVVEVIAGTSGAALVFVFPHLTEWLKPLYQPVADLPWVFNTIRLALSFALFVAPATAMGTTLPLLVKALQDGSTEYGSVLGRLYGWNTLGAVSGTVMTEMVLIGPLGMQGTAVLAGGLNLVSAIVALSLWSKLSDSHTRASEMTSEGSRLSKLSPRARRLLASGCLSGAIILALEVVWFRFLLLFVDALSLAFAVMLAVVLTGIGIGGIIASYWYRRDAEAHRHLVSVALMAGASALLAFRAFDLVVPGVGGLTLPGLRTLYLSVPLMLPVSFFSGILFTLIGGAVYREMGSALDSTGLLTMSNTLGAMLGSLLAGFVLVPHVGMEISLLALAATYAAVGLCCFESGGRLASPWVKYTSYAVAAVFVACLASFPFGSLHKHLLAVGENYFRHDPEWKPVRIHEGLTETSQYWQKQVMGTPLCTRLFTNSHSMASNCFGGRRYMKLFVYWPVAVHPRPRDALLICYGLGSTAKALTDTKCLRSVTIVDISPDILHGSRTVFPDPHDDPLHDSRVKVRVEDGRFFLQTTNKKFDIITGEPPPPLQAGVVNLYSREYFQLVYNSLREGGIVTYWLPVSQIPWTGIKSILKAFSSVFPDCSVWTAQGFEWMMVGTRNALGPISEDQFSRQWEDRVVAPELLRCGFETPEQIGATFLMDYNQLQRWIGPVQPVVDNYPRRIFGIPEDYYERTIADLEDLMSAETARKRFEESRFIAQLWPATLREKTLPFFGAQKWLNEALCTQTPPDITTIMECVHETLTKSKLRMPILLMAGGPAYPDLEPAMALIGAGLSRSSLRLDAFPGLTAMADRDFPTAIADFASQTNGRGDRNLTFFQVYLECLTGHYEDARGTVKKHKELFTQGKHSDFLNWLSKTFDLSSSFWQGEAQ